MTAFNDVSQPYIPEDKKKTLEKLLMITVLFDEKNLSGFIPSARIERMKDRQKNLFSLIDFKAYYPVLYNQTVRDLSREHPHLSLPFTRDDIESLAVENMKKTYEMVFEYRIKPSKDFSSCLAEAHKLNSFFEAESNFSIHTVDTLVRQIDTLLNDTVNHLTSFLMIGIINIAEVETFKELSLQDVIDVQKACEHILDHLGLDPQIEKIFNHLIIDEESTSLSVIGALSLVNEFLLGYLSFQKIFDGNLNLSRNEKRSLLEKAIKHFDDAGKDILCEETLAYLQKESKDIVKLAHSLGVDSLCSSIRVNLLRPKSP